MLSSRIVLVEIEDRRFHLHSASLCCYSERFKKCLTGPFQEAKELKIELVDEMASRFVHFAMFIYDSHQAPWKPPSTLDVCSIAKLYAMGERLIAEDFQKTVLASFIKRREKQQITTVRLCELLSVACNQITARPHPNDDPMRVKIFDLAASRLSDLQKLDNFRQMLDDYDDLAKELCVRARNSLVVAELEYLEEKEVKWTYGLHRT